MAEMVSWQNPADRADIVRRAAQALTQGQLVAFPTETVYGLAASALLPDAVERLRTSKGRPDDKPMTLAVASAAEALDWAPQMSPLARRLARRCWPGPVTLVVGNALEEGLASRLAPSVQQQVCPSGTIGLRVPAHEAVLQTLSAIAGPLVLTSANLSGEPPATRAEEVAAAVGTNTGLIIDDGPSRYGQASTIVQVQGEHWKVLRAGVLSEAEIRQQTARLILFVCSGNTCRSPLAEALCKKLLAEELGCSPAELPQRGIIVLSAGLAAMMGSGAAAEAILVAQELGADLTGHASRPLMANLLAQTDDLIVMTRSHALSLAAHFPRSGPRPRLLSPEGEDLPDPIGGDQEVYRECARLIEGYLRAWLPEWIGAESRTE